MIQIKLDIPALNALFPEGTEARVQLQKSCIENFAHAHIKNIGTEAKAMIEDARVRTIKQIEDQYTKKDPSSWGNRLLSDDMKRKITDEAEHQIRSQIRDSIDKAIQNTVETLDFNKRIERLLNEHIDRYTNQCVQKMIQEKFQQAMNALGSK